MFDRVDWGDDHTRMTTNDSHDDTPRTTPPVLIEPHLELKGGYVRCRACYAYSVPASMHLYHVCQAVIDANAPSDAAHHNH